MADDQRTDGMLALVPEDPDLLAVDGGVDPGELHLILLYLGDDVGSWEPEQMQRLRELVAASAPGLDPVTARVIGHGVLNPDGREPTEVYLIGDAPGIAPVRDWAAWALANSEEQPTPPKQFDPFIPHISATTYGDLSALSYTGEIRFDRLRLALADSVEDFVLGEAAEDEEIAAEPEPTFTPPANVRRAAAGQRGATAYAVAEGKALDAAGLEWVAAHCGAAGAQWAQQCAARAEIKEQQHRPVDNEEDETPEILRAPPFDADTMPAPPRRNRKRRPPRGRAVHANFSSTPSGAAALESKVMSPSPGAARLRHYWAKTAKGRAKWRPGTPGDFKRLRRHLAKYVKNPRVLNGLTANIHKLGTGFWPGPGRGPGRHKTLIDWIEVEVKGIHDLEWADEVVLAADVGDWDVFAEEDVSGYSPEDLAEDDPEFEIKEPPKDEDDPLARYARLGDTMVADAESYEDTVERDDRYEMDAAGALRRTSAGETRRPEQEEGLFGPDAWLS